MRLEDGRALPAFVCQALRNQPLSVFGKGEQTRSFCFVSDLVAGLTALIETDYPEPVNIGNPDEVSILDFAGEIIALTGSKSPIAFKPMPIDDPHLRRPDISLARRLLGWEPKVSRREGLERTIPYFRKSLGL
jgi:dTDP-glucose 4,6-dehydratase